MSTTTYIIKAPRLIITDDERAIDLSSMEISSLCFNRCDQPYEVALGRYEEVVSPPQVQEIFSATVRALQPIVAAIVVTSSIVLGLATSVFAVAALR